MNYPILMQSPDGSKTVDVFSAEEADARALRGWLPCGASAPAPSLPDNPPVEFPPDIPAAVEPAPELADDVPPPVDSADEA